MAKDAVRSLQWKHKTMTDVYGRHLKAMIDDLKARQDWLDNFNVLLNQRVKDYTLLRMSFEYQRQSQLSYREELPPEAAVTFAEQ